MEKSQVIIEFPTKLVENLIVLENDPDKCPVCGHEVIHMGHCKMCEDCYWSACEL